MTEATPGPKVFGSPRRRILCAVLLACGIDEALPGNEPPGNWQEY